MCVVRATDGRTSYQLVRDLYPLHIKHHLYLGWRQFPLGYHLTLSSASTNEGDRKTNAQEETGRKKERLVLCLWVQRWRSDLIANGGKKRKGKEKEVRNHYEKILANRRVELV